MHEEKRISKSNNETTAIKKYVCEICEQVFNNYKNRNRHVRCVHEGKKPYSCIICKKAFGKNFNLKKHISSVHDKEKAFKCKLCSANFSRKASLTHHENNCAQLSMIHPWKKSHNEAKTT